MQLTAIPLVIDAFTNKCESIRDDNVVSHAATGYKKVGKLIPELYIKQKCYEKQCATH